MDEQLTELEELLSEYVAEVYNGNGVPSRISLRLPVVLSDYPTLAGLLDAALVRLAQEEERS